MYPWNKIEKNIERIEYERVLNELSLLEQREGFVRIQPTWTERTKGYLEFLGKLCVGVSVGIFTIMCNFLLFVWLLHAEVNPQFAGTFEKRLRDLFATADFALPGGDSLETAEHWAEEKLNETGYALKSAARYAGQAVTWVSHGVESGAVNATDGVRSALSKLIKSPGWSPEDSGKGAKERTAVLPEEGLERDTEAAKKEIDELQQHKNFRGDVYAIQVGAFRNYSNACALKTRLIKRGYNAYVAFTGPENRERIFKLCTVWIGGFERKEEAVRVSTEIEKAEGLQAFVTLKNGQENIH